MDERQGFDPPPGRQVDHRFRMENGRRAAALYEAPFSYAITHVRAERVARQERGYARDWWRHERPRPEMWRALIGKYRYVATSMVAKHRTFLWLSTRTVPANVVIVITRDDDTIFGILHSRFHLDWALRLGTWLGV